jgi:hypothetical protein
MMYVFKEVNGTYNPQKTEGKPWRVNEHKVHSYYRDDETKLNLTSTENLTGDRHPTSILPFPEKPDEQEQREHEMMYIFKETGISYNPQKTEGKPYKTAGHINSGYYDVREGYDWAGVNNTGDRYPTTIVKFNNPVKSLHRTEKPVDLCEWLIKSYSNEGDIVLDFTMGSGTTGIACLNTKRNFIGIEKDDTIYKIAHHRIFKKELEMTANNYLFNFKIIPPLLYTNHTINTDEMSDIAEIMGRLTAEQVKYNAKKSKAGATRVRALLLEVKKCADASRRSILEDAKAIPVKERTKKLVPIDTPEPVVEAVPEAVVEEKPKSKPRAKRSKPTEPKE